MGNLTVDVQIMPDTRYAPYDWHYDSPEDGSYYLAGLRFEGLTLALAGPDDAERVAAIDHLTAELAKLRASAVERIAVEAERVAEAVALRAAPGYVLPTDSLALPVDGTEPEAVPA